MPKIPETSWEGDLVIKQRYLRAIQNKFYGVLKNHPELQKLNREHPVSFDIRPWDGQTLGYYSSKENLIVLKQSHIQHGEHLEWWSTLIHEMAHWVQFKYLNSTGKAHDEVFAQALSLLGHMDYLDHIPVTFERGVAAKVKKLLALAEKNPNEHEAQSALKKARELIIKYNVKAFLGQGDSDPILTYQLYGPTGRIPRYVRSLASLLEVHFYTELVWWTLYCPKRNKRIRTLEVMGVQSNLQVALHVFKCLCRMLPQMWDTYLEEHKDLLQGKHLSVPKNNFYDGVIEGFRSQLKETTAKVSQSLTPEEQALVKQGDPRLREAFISRYPKLGKMGVSASTKKHEHAKEAGRVLGKVLKINTPIQSGKSVKGHLTS